MSGTENLTPAEKAQKTRIMNNPEWGKKKKCKSYAVYTDPNHIHDLLASYAAERDLIIYKLYEQMIFEFLLKKKKAGVKSIVFTKQSFNKFLEKWNTGKFLN